MQKVGVLCLALSALLISAPVQTDIFGVSHSCSKPYKPFEFTDEWQLENFRNDVERYQQCLLDFVEEQNDSIRNHQNAIDEAIDEWESFVRNELR